MTLDVEELVSDNQQYSVGSKHASCNRFFFSVDFVQHYEFNCNRATDSFHRRVGTTRSVRRVDSRQATSEFDRRVNSACPKHGCCRAIRISQSNCRDKQASKREQHDGSYCGQRRTLSRHSRVCRPITACAPGRQLPVPFLRRIVALKSPAFDVDNNWSQKKCDQRVVCLPCVAR